MLHTSAALGLALSGYENISKDPFSPLHLMALRDIRKVSCHKGYYPFPALISSGATYNYISQTIVDKLNLEVANAGKKKKNEIPPPVTAVNSEPLCPTVVVRHKVQMSDSTGVKQSHAINFIIANIAHNDLILKTAWLQKKGTDIY